MSVAPVVAQAVRSRGVAGLLAALAIVFAVGCANVPTAPATIGKAVATPCPTAMPDKPAFPAGRLTGDEDIWTLATSLWADRLARMAYELQLEVRLRVCIEPAPP